MPVVPSSPLSVFNLTNGHQSTQATAQGQIGIDLSAATIDLTKGAPLATEPPVTSSAVRADMARTTSWNAAQIVLWLWLIGTCIRGRGASKAILFSA